ncbi:MAG: hypothetical protein JO366_22475 [Methylobacteriaceae bacterium]|nr:hypothetical protein [Methylobacteriaceae bacterium]MBV9247572.1 hypothetical protein [Methylobacteriaceae bacterium]
MVGFTFSSEQLQTAPPDVRRWIEIEIGRALAMASKGNHNHATQQVIRLAECAAEEAAQIFELTCSNFIAAKVFFELGRDIPCPYLRGMPQMRLLNVVDTLHHVQLSDSKVLIASCDLINQAFQQARGDPEASLFASDGAGHIYIHEITPPQHPTAWDRLVAPERPVSASMPGEENASPHRTLFRPVPHHSKIGSISRLNMHSHPLRTLDLSDRGRPERPQCHRATEVQLS